MKEHPDKFMVHLATLRQRLPTIVPTRVRRTRLACGSLGDCCARYSDDGHLMRFDIRIAKEAPYQLQLHVLMHEYAHALAWTEDDGSGEVDDHGPEFGLAYARVYQAME